MPSTDVVQDDYIRPHSFVGMTAGMIKHVDLASLKAGDRVLLSAAEDFLTLAYAPYSGFLVGAALLTKSGKVAGGANQENASYPLCMCGERVALYNAAIHYPDDPIVTIAIVVRGKHPLKSPAPPCGACLQVLREFELRQKGDIRLLLRADGPEVWEAPGVSTLLPVSFDSTFLF